MNTDWFLAMEENNWQMPTAPRWKRWPIIRHLRACRAAIMVKHHNSLLLSLGFIPSGFDRWVVAGIWGGMERDNG